MFDNLAKVLQEANALIDHYNQLNQLNRAQTTEITQLRAENIKLKEEAESAEDRTRP